LKAEAIVVEALQDAAQALAHADYITKETCAFSSSIAIRGARDKVIAALEH